LYSSIEKVKELKLVKTKIDSKKYPPRDLASPTKKGAIIAEKDEDIIRTIGDSSG
jgi:hypothetical protein